MTLSSGWAVGILLLVSATLGALPILDWIVRQFARQRLSQVGTGNLSVSAAFYHGGTLIGLLAVLSEAAKGMIAVLVARSLFPSEPMWELIALMALVIGRYVTSGGAGTTNVVWGYVVHDWRIAMFVLVVGGVLFVTTRRRQLARLGVLVLLPMGEGIWGNGIAAIATATMLAGLMAWIYYQIPDDLALSSNRPVSSSRAMFRFLQGRHPIYSLDQAPQISQMGQKAATLAALRQAGYPVPAGWVLPPGADPIALLQTITDNVGNPWSQPWIVRSSALDEDGATTSAAGQYQSIPQVRSSEELLKAINQCRESYFRGSAQQYRRDRGQMEMAGMAVLVQPQIPGQYSGVAFSRDPVNLGETVWVEAIAGSPEQVVSGQVTPELYRLSLAEDDVSAMSATEVGQISSPVLPQGADIDIHSEVVKQVARLTRHLELHYHGIPQDIEWTFDGQKLWLLQARPITTLTPIWTRKIAAEVIPGVIRPLTWSINRPLTCGVWGKIFQIVLGDRTHGLNFNETATLHYDRAYFNATLLGDIFRRMGLPPESLEFLTLGSKFSKPPLLSTLRNLPGLLRLLRREWELERSFERDRHQTFAPLLTDLALSNPVTLSSITLLNRIDTILTALDRATYYSILAPLSFALRRSLFRVSETDLDTSQLPEVASIEAVQQLAAEARQTYPALLSPSAAGTSLASSVSEHLEHIGAGKLLTALEQLAHEYSFLSEVGTDISVATWRENPQILHALFAQFVCNPPPAITSPIKADTDIHRWQHRQAQARLNLKGQVATVYLQLLAELRWSIVALEKQAIAQHLICEPGDIFFLTYEELKDWLGDLPTASATTIQSQITARRSRYERHLTYDTIPFIVYGNNPPPAPPPVEIPLPTKAASWQGIGASVGQVQGTVKVLRTLQADVTIPPQTILVVPYTDAGWAPLLARATGIVSEVGGRLSHGAIVAREYSIPAVMNIPHATQLFQDGQTLRLDGRTGVVELVTDGLS